MHSSTQVNMKKRSYDDADLSDEVMYGIVSTGVDWAIVKLKVGTGGNSDIAGEVTLSESSPFVLPISEHLLNREYLKGKLESLFKQIMWVFNEQIGSKNVQKRVRVD